jgi:cell division protein FtsB
VCKFLYGGEKVKKKKRNTVLKITILFFVCFFASLFYNKFSSLKSYNKEIDALKAQIAEQEEYTKQLEKVSKEYDSDEFIEKFARSLGLVKPNEKIFRNYNEK